MLKLISLNHTVMLNGYSQQVNIVGGGGNFIEKSVLFSVILAFSHKKIDAIKQILKIYCLYVVCTLI